MKSDVPPSAVLIATGTEVSIALKAAAKLTHDNIPTTVVSAPCLELFDKQSKEYRRQVYLILVSLFNPLLIGSKQTLPIGVPVFSVEAQGPFGWSSHSHFSIAVPEWGASAPSEVVWAIPYVTMINNN